MLMENYFEILKIFVLSWGEDELIRAVFSSILGLMIGVTILEISWDIKKRQISTVCTLALILLSAMEFWYIHPLISYPNNVVKMTIIIGLLLTMLIGACGHKIVDQSLFKTTKRKP